MASPILTLTTDFGLFDHYVGVMKGVILGICPRARIVDISHDVKPFAIAEGAYLIAQAYRYFPPKTVHVVVVDPGVGTDRRAILVEAAGQYFIAPDNGVMAMIYSREAHKVRLISTARYFRKPVSATFHGRDIFAPVAAHVAAGVPASRVGKIVRDYVRPEFEKPRRTGERAWLGRVLHVDRFGNVVTNFEAADFPDLERRDLVFTLAREASGADLQVCAGPPGPALDLKPAPARRRRPARGRVADQGVRIAALARTYAEKPPGELFAIAASSGYIEFSMNQSSAASLIGCAPGATVKLTMR